MLVTIVFFHARSFWLADMMYGTYYTHNLLHDMHALLVALIRHCYAVLRRLQMLCK